MRAVPQRSNGRLGGTDQLAYLGIDNFRTIAQNPQNSRRLVAALRRRKHFFVLAVFRLDVAFRFNPDKRRGRILFAAGNFVRRQLTAGNRIQPDDVKSDVAVGNRLHFQLVQFAEIADLFKSQSRIFNQPDGCCLGH